MPLMVVKLPRDERKSWALAVAASFILHVAVFGILPKGVSYSSPKQLEKAPSSAARADESGPPIVLSLVTEPVAPPVAPRVTEAQPRQPTPDATDVPTEPKSIAETGSGMGAQASDEVGEPAPAGAPGEAPIGPLGEPSGMRRGVPGQVLGDGLMKEGGQIAAPDVQALEPAYDSAAVEGEGGQAEQKKGGGIGGFLRGVGDFLEGIEVRGGGSGGIGGGGDGGLGGHGGGGKGGGCGPKIPNIGVPGQGPLRPGGRVGGGMGGMGGIGMGGRPIGGGFRVLKGDVATSGMCASR